MEDRTRVSRVMRENFADENEFQLFEHIIAERRLAAICGLFTLNIKDKRLKIINMKKKTFLHSSKDTEGLSDTFYLSRYVETDIVSPHAINCKLLFKSHVLRKAGFFIWNVVLIIVSNTHTHTHTRIQIRQIFGPYVPFIKFHQ